MKIFVIGCKGQLGNDMMALCAERGHDVKGIDFPDIDITNASGTKEIVTTFEPAIIINCAAYTAVDAAETNEQAAYAVNAHGVANLARAAAVIGAPLVHFSTDYVFDGAKKQPYVETDAPNPISAYGRTKLLGEQMLMEATDRFFIVRIAWLYGQHGGNFVKTIRTIGRQKKQNGEVLRVVHDQIGSPTCTVDVCRQVMSLIETGAYGLYHCTSEGECSWYDFARRIIESAGIGTEVHPCSTAEFPRPAPRPANSVLENARLKAIGINQMPHWRDAFDAFVKREGENG